MLYDYAITPDIFARASELQDAAPHLLYLFERIEDNGILLNMSDGLWCKAVRQTIQGMPGNNPFKKKYMEKLENLAKRGRILDQNRQMQRDMLSPSDWLNEAYLLNQLEKIDDVITSRKCHDEFRTKFSCLEYLDDVLSGGQWEKRDSSRSIRRSKEEMSKYLKKMISTALCVMVVDPWLGENTVHYKDIFDILITASYGLRGVSKLRQLQIHTAFKRTEKYERDDKISKCISEFKNLVKEIGYRLPEGLNLYVNFWKERNRKDPLFKQFHNRYIITNHGGISFGIGADFTAWDTKDDDDISMLPETLRKQRSDEFSNYSDGPYTRIDYKVLSSEKLNSELKLVKFPRKIINENQDG